MTEPSDTPLTDEEAGVKKLWHEFTHKGGSLDGVVDGYYRYEGGDTVSAEFARNLERQLSEARTEAEGLRKERDRLVVLAASGRLTVGEYERYGKPDGWTWNERVRMWCRCDQDHWEAIQRAETAEREAAEARQKVIEEGAQLSWILLMDYCRTLRVSPGDKPQSQLFALPDALRALLKEKP